MDTLVVAVGGFLLLLVGLVVLRAATKNRFEIKNSDIALALVPVGLWLLLTGKVQEFGFGDFKVVAAAFREASTSRVEHQVTLLPMENIRTNEKMAVDAIPSMARDGTSALSFRLGHGGYWGPAVRDYLAGLSRLRYLVINNADGSLFGTLDARIVTEIFTRTNQERTSGPSHVEEFAAWLNRADTSSLKRMPTFMSAAAAVTVTTDKSEALRKMEDLDVPTLPVINDKRVFVGIVDRAKLTTSMLLEVSKRLEGGS